MKIAVFDSGIGGVTVLKELIQRFPSEDFFYFGDNANLPYGTKSPEQIKNLAISAAKYISGQKVDALVVACNTASCIAIEEIRKVMGDKTPVFSVVDAGVESVVQNFKKLKSTDKPILILGTRATVRSHTYLELIHGVLGEKVQVIERECPLLVPMIEESWIHHKILEQTVYEYLKAYEKLPGGVALLACTHYPWIKTTFEKLLPSWQFFDSAVAMGEALSKHFPSHQTKKTSNVPSEVHWQFSDPESVPAFVFSKELGSAGLGS